MLNHLRTRRFEQDIGQPAAARDLINNVFMENEQRQLAVLGMAAQFLNNGPITRSSIL